MIDRKKYRVSFQDGERRYMCTECGHVEDGPDRVIDHFNLAHDDPGGVLVRVSCQSDDCDFSRVYHEEESTFMGVARSRLEKEANRAIAGHKSHYPNHHVTRL